MAYAKKIATPAQRIKEILALRRMTQTQLSEVTGLSKPVISSYVTGKYQPKPDSLARLSAALGVAEYWLAGYDVPMTDDDAPTTESSPTPIGEIIKTARLKKNLSQEQLGDLLDVGKSCVSKWERGAVTDLKRSSMQGLNEILGIPLEDLVAATHADDEQCESRVVFAENLAFYLQQTGETQKSIAEVIGVSAPTVNEWLKAKKYPRPEKLEKLARYFGVSMTELVGDRDNSSALPNEREIMAQNINYYMAVKGITRKQLCDALGFHYSTLADWLQGRTYPRIDKIVAMANYLGCDKSDLIEIKDRSKPQTPIVLDNDVLELLALYQRCNVEQKRSINQMLRCFVDAE